MSYINPITQLPVDISELPADLRQYLLGLEAPRSRGRPKALTFQKRVEIAQAWGEALNRHAELVRNRGRDREIAKLQAKFRRLCAEQAAPHKIAAVQTDISKLGRFTRVPIKPPDAALPEIDVAIAKLFDIKPRMVRRIRTDPRMQALMPHRVWLERDWERDARKDFEARQLAKRLGVVFRGHQIVGGQLRAPIRTRRGAEVEIVPGPGPRHRVGCESGFPSVPGVSRRRHGNVIVISFRDRPNPAHALAAWKFQQRAWGERSAQELEGLPTLRIATCNPWWHVWKKDYALGWAGEWGKICECGPWTITGKRIVLSPVVSPPTPNKWRTPWVLPFAGSITECRTFAHALPMGWKAQYCDKAAEVLGPHSTWRWMATKLFDGTPVPRDGEAYDYLRHYRVTWEAKGSPKASLIKKLPLALLEMDLNG